MKRLAFLMAFLILAASCGKKGDPHPIESLNIPVPTWAEISVEDDGVHITNPSSDQSIRVERAESEVGDLFLPFYQTIAEIKPKESFVDNATESDIRYLYRIRAKHSKYEAYSAPTVRVVSYKGSVAVEKAGWQIINDEICLDLTFSSNVSSYEIFINGQKTDNISKCQKLPPISTILLVIVPYSDHNIPGKAYSVSINREPDTLLPPQNVKVLRRNEQITLSWDPIESATTTL